MVKKCNVQCSAIQLYHLFKIGYKMYTPRYKKTRLRRVFLCRYRLDAHSRSILTVHQILLL